MEKFLIGLEQKKGMAKVDKKIDTLIGAVLLILFVVVIVPVIFGDEGLGGTGMASAPVWVTALLTVMIGFGLVMLVYRSIQ